NVLCCGVVLESADPAAAIVADCEAKGKPWVDKDFPCDDRALFLDPRRPVRVNNHISPFFVKSGFIVLTTVILSWLSLLCCCRFMWHGPQANWRDVSWVRIQDKYGPRAHVFQPPLDPNHIKQVLFFFSLPKQRFHELVSSVEHRRSFI